jgi:uncharacterized protein DUF3105
MRVVKALPEVLMWALIAGMALVNVVVYTHIVRGEDAIDLRESPPPGVPRLATTPVAGSTPTRAADRAELDDSAKLPGTFVPSQGRQHTGGYPLATRVPFCPEHEISNSCYASNPPTSGLHLPVTRGVLLADGNRIDIPPNPAVYDFQIPREAIPHIEEHAGVYIGFNCGNNDACDQAAERLKDLVTQEVSLGARVVLSPDPDLGDDEIGMASWTRYDAFNASDYSDDRVRSFIKAHSCRFDPEGFCKDQPALN